MKAVAFGAVGFMFSMQRRADRRARVHACSGYMSPEYAMDGVFSVKSDVFSFGVLLIEILGEDERDNNDMGREDGSWGGEEQMTTTT